MTQTAYRGATADGARAVCVFLHGRGQSPEEMDEAVVARLQVEGLRWVLPRAPGGSWYAAKAVDPLTETTEVELRDALVAVEAAVGEARRRSPGVPVMVAGFSQGACLALEYLMRGGEVEAAAILTGCRVGAASEGLPRADLVGRPVYASCGDADSWIPLWAFHKAGSDLSAAGARLRTDILPGRPHEISDREIAELRLMLDNVVAGRPALEAAE